MHTISFEVMHMLNSLPMLCYQLFAPKRQLIAKHNADGGQQTA